LRGGRLPCGTPAVVLEVGLGPLCELQVGIRLLGLGQDLLEIVLELRLVVARAVAGRRSCAPLLQRGCRRGLVSRRLDDGIAVLAAGLGRPARLLGQARRSLTLGRVARVMIRRCRRARHAFRGTRETRLRHRLFPLVHDFCVDHILVTQAIWKLGATLLPGILGEALTERTGLDAAFLCNSGTEAVEGTIKFARAVTGRAKVLAAYRAGIRELIMPKANEKDLRDVPPEVRELVVFSFVDRMDDVLRLALLPAVDDDVADLTHLEPSAGLTGMTTPHDREQPISAHAAT